MTVEDKIKMQIGELIVAVLRGNAQLEAAQARIQELEEKYEPKDAAK